MYVCTCFLNGGEGDPSFISSNKVANWNRQTRKCKSSTLEFSAGVNDAVQWFQPECIFPSWPKWIGTVGHSQM